MNDVLFVLIAEYADWEPALLAAGLRKGFGLWEPRYRVKTVAPRSAPVRSIGGFTTVPDYTFDNAPDDFAALVLVGGTDWFGPDAEAVLPLVRKALAHNAVVGAICDASMFLGAHGFLNAVRHTSNDLSTLKNRPGTLYAGAPLYQSGVPSVRDGNIVTANGAGFIEFAQNMFEALNAASPEKTAIFRDFCKTGMFPG